MLQPKRSKYRKAFRGKNRGVATRGNTIAFGVFGLQATEHGQFSARQIEAARKVLAHTTKRVGSIYIRIFPDHPLTVKPLGVKMGSGKGDIKEYVCKIQPEKMLFELGGVTEALAREAFRKAGHKIPMKTRFVAKKLTAAEAQAEVIAQAEAIEAAKALEAEEAAEETAVEEVKETQEGEQA
jgi:large subunit ribosomal protein L16